MKISIVVELFGGCFADVHALRDKPDAKKYYKKQIKEDLNMSVEEYERLHKDGQIDKEEPILIEEVELQ